MTQTGIIAQEIGSLRTVAGAAGSTYLPMGSANGINTVPAVPFAWASENPTVSTVKGELLTAETLVYDAALQLPLLDKDKIRRKLAEELVEKLLNGKFIEFTQQRIPDLDAIAIRARCYVVPDSQVKIVRDKV
jgi:hypothetical protein